MKQLIHRALQAVGHDLVPYPVPDWLWLRQHLLILFALLGVNCVLDVGGHFGEYGGFLREIGYNDEIVSFEPIEENYKKLVKRAKGDGKWRTYPYALGTENGTQTINVAHCTDFSSFLEPSSFSSDRFGEKGKVERRETVTVRRLDSIFDEAVAGVSNPRVYLKMDTQGWDLNVLAGAIGILHRVEALQSEISVKNIYQQMTSYPDALRQMTDMGFELSGLFPVVREGELRVIELDCVMVRATAQELPKYRTASQKS